MANTLHRNERLKSRKRIQLLFQRGRKLQSSSLGLRWMLEDAGPGEAGTQLGVTVSARNFRKAVDRNRIKRLLRECWRINRAGLGDLPGEGRQLLVFLIYTAGQEPQFAPLNEEMKEMIARLVSTLKNAS